MHTAVALTLAAAALLQVIAAVLALRAVPYSGSFRYAWIALSVGLVLMIERRIQPMLDFHGRFTDLLDALFALLVSAMLAFSVFGLVRLLRTIRANQDHLARLSITDPLTGLANRRHLLAELEREISRANRGGHPVSVLMLDLDRFKSINDRYGHAVGDTVLVAVAARCAERLRAIDLCGRLGGEEFAILLPETDSKGATAVAQRIRSDLADVPIETTSGPLAVTVSIGVAMHEAGHAPDGAAAADDVTAQAHLLLRRADDALYAAKATGRNTVCNNPGNLPAHVEFALAEDGRPDAA
jgi:diguanylate cyclase (GGDEF)-like protein